MATYRELKQLIEAGAIDSFDDIFLFIEQKKFREDTGISVRRLKALRALPSQMTFEEAFDIAELLDIDSTVFVDLMKKWGKINQQ